jgi:hypothetical protein
MRRDRTHTIGEPRQLAEEAAEFRVDPLANVAIGLQQILIALEVELPVGAEKLDEFTEAALEMRLANDRFHLLPNARHFSEADIVDLLRREISSRVVAHRERVPFWT